MIATASAIVRTAGQWRLVVEPELGGGIRSLTFADRPVLAEDPEQPDPVLALGCFAMVPFANRIRDGRLSLPDGSTATLEPHRIADPVHPLHGTGWRARWSVRDTGPDDGVHLTLSHAGDGHWPFPFDAQLIYRITAELFIATVILRATGGPPVPASIGLHPWFPAEGARLSVRAGTLWAPDRNRICSVPAAHAGFSAATVSDLDLDHCLTGWDGAAQVRLAGRAFGIEARSSWPGRSSRTGALHLYIPPGGGRFCLEPQTARSGAFEQPGDSADGPVLLGRLGEDLVQSLRVIRRPDLDG